MSKASNSAVRTTRESLRARVICMREILVAYVCILLIESACLFPAVWVR